MNDADEKIEEIKRLLSANELLNKRIYTLPEAAQYMGISKSQLYKLTSSRRVEHYCPRGKQIYFTKESLENHMLQNRVPTQDEIKQKASGALVSNKK